MRKGMSLIEVLLVIVLLGLMVLITVPHLERPLATITVENEVQRLARAHMRARMLALTSSQVAVLQIRPDSITIVLVAQGDTTVRWQEAGPAARQVALSGPSHAILVAPTAIGLGVSNGTWTVEYHGVRRSMVLSRLGRLRIVH